MPGTRPLGITLLAAFFFFGAAMASLAAISLATPGGSLEPMWRINPDGRAAFGPMGAWGIALLAVVGSLCAAAAFGLWRLAPWGRRVAIVLLCVNAVGDLANAIGRGDLRALVGVPVAGGLVFYLTRQRVRGAFVGDRRVG